MDGEASLSKIDMQASAVFKRRWQSTFISTSKEDREGGQMEEWHAGMWMAPPSVRSSPIKHFCGKYYLV